MKAPPTRRSSSPTLPCAGSDLDHDQPSQLAADGDLRRYVRRSLWKAALTLALFVAAIASVSWLYAEQLSAAANLLYLKLGVLGLCLVVFVCDCLTAPFPPDVVLVIIAKSALRTSAWQVVLLIGLVSILAGNCAFYLGRALQRWPWAARWLARAGAKPKALIQGYGRSAVALAALTPIPFSITCVLAGLLGMEHARFWPVTLLRIPRFLLYFAVIYWL